MTILQTILAAVGWQTRVNENFRSVSPAGLYGIDPATTTGLTLGYLGGEFSGVSVASGTVALTASATNYVVAHRTTGAVMAATNTTNWANTTTYLKLYQFTVGTATFDANEAGADKRQAIGGAGGGGDVVGPASSTADRVVTFDGTTGKLIKDSGTLLSALAPKASPAFTGSATAVDITFSGLALTTASTTVAAGLRLPHGTAPTAPTNGDVWSTTAGIYAQINGSTVGPFGAGGGGGMTNPMTTTGDIIYSSSGSTPARLAIGTGTQVLGISAGVPAWVASGGFTGGALTSAVDEAKGADIARAATTNIGAATGNFVHLTGTTTITGLGTVQAGTRRIVRFAGAGTLTHNGTSLILPGAANITTAANDTAIFVSEGSGNWRCVAYTRANGTALVATTGASLTNFTGSLNTASPNGTVNSARLLVTGGTTDVDFVIQPKGSGALLAQLPDGTTTGGNKRGNGAVDFQMSRSNASDVASGNNAVICGGGTNEASGATSTVAGGDVNKAQGLGSTVSGGSSNTASGQYSTVSGGVDCTASGFRSNVTGGATNIASGDYAIVTGGSNNEANGAYSSAQGFHANAKGMHGAEAFATGNFSVEGDAQTRRSILRAATANTTATAATSDAGAAAANNQFSVPTGSALKFTAEVAAFKTSTGDASSWTVSGLAKSIGGTVSLVGTPTVTKDFSDAGASTWALAVVADTVNGTIRFNVTGQAASNIVWVLSVQTVEAGG